MADEFRLDWDGDKVLAAMQNADFEGAELAGEHLLQVSSGLAPHEEGDLARSGEVSSDRGSGAVAVSYDRPYLGCSPARRPDPQARRRPHREVLGEPDARGERRHARPDRQGCRQAAPVD